MQRLILRSMVLLSCTIAVSSATADDRAKPATDFEAMQGTWEIVNLPVINAMRYDRMLIVSDERVGNFIKLIGEVGSRGYPSGATAYRFRMNSATTPKEVDLFSLTDGDGKKLLGQGIYELDGDKLVMPRLSHASHTLALPHGMGIRRTCHPDGGRQGIGR